jgi:hypothetical protein
MMQKDFPTIGCCGLDCGLCPAYYADGASKCPGCFGPNFSTKRRSCGVITCCAKGHGLEVCALCGDFPCEKFSWRLDSSVDSVLTYKNLRSNIKLIQQEGLEEFLQQQERRITLLDRMLRDFNDGRSRSPFCVAATLLPIDALEQILSGMDGEIASDNFDPSNKKALAKELKRRLNDFAAENGIDLKLRRKST